MKKRWLGTLLHRSVALLVGIVPLIILLPNHTQTSTPSTGTGPDDPDIAAFVHRVEGLVQAGEVMGVEVLLMRSDAVFLHQAFGWKNREAEVPLKIGTIYNIRSMTKPMASTLTQMLIERGVVALDDRVSDYLPSFDNDQSRTITLAQLLTHRGGYQQGPPGTSWTRYQSLRAIADYWGETGPSLPLDGPFSYADAHADILGAVLEVATGHSAHWLLETEVFQPLGLYDTFTRLPADDPRRARIAPLYVGSSDSWTLRWTPEEDPYYPFAMFAQSAYSSAMDYARFLRFWLNCGEVDGMWLLSCRAVKRAFGPREPIQLPPALFPIAKDRIAAYGHFWGTTFNVDEQDADMPFAFAHQGTDGTAAYAFPALDLIAVVLSQSRGTSALPAIEQALLEHIVDPLIESK